MLKEWFNKLLKLYLKYIKNIVVLLFEKQKKCILVFFREHSERSEKGPKNDMFYDI